MTLPRTVVWEPEEPDFRGTDLVRLERTATGFRAEGSVTAVEAGAPWAVRFAVVTDDAWRTRTVAIESIAPAGIARRALEADGAGAWRCDGAPRPDLAGCLDVDLAATPFTNTLAMRRLGLSIGASAEIRVAWVGAPNLELRAMVQRYTRLATDDHGHDRYEFYAPETDFRAVLTTDDEGLVVRYTGLARRIAAG